MKGTTVTIKNVGRSFGQVRAVDDVSLDIEAGEFVSLLGPSGSGKTTLLMMIAGFEFPDSGEIHVAGCDITFLPANRRNIGMVFQRYALFPHLSVSQNIGFPLKLRRLPRAKIADRVERMLALVQLEGLGDRMPSQLSGGQQQRVAVARALVFEPPVLLMDEPLGALDKKLREQMQIELKQLHERIGVTIIYVTHDQEEALTMSDRVVILDRGRIIQAGRPTDLYLRPANPFVADFVGRMNILPARVKGAKNGDVVLELNGGQELLGRWADADTPAATVAGQRVKIAVRPENVTISGGSGDDAAGRQNRLRGTISGTIFAGSYSLLLVETANDSTFLAQVPGIPEAGFNKAGDEVTLQIDPDALVVYASAEPERG